MKKEGVELALKNDVTNRYWYVFSGAYAAPDETGIQLLLFDTATGKLKHIGGVSGIENPSFLALGEDATQLFAVSETKNGAVVSYAVEPSNGVFREINRQSTAGSAPCYLSVDDTGKWLYSLNYSSGSVCVFPIEENGNIGEMRHETAHVGHSVNADRQEAPHPHTIVTVPNSDYLLVTDLGTDTIYVYRHDVAQMTFTLHATTQTTPGAGPRHIAFHPTLRVLYVIEELSSTVTTYAYDVDSMALTPLQTVTTLPDDFAGSNTCADVHVTSSGRFLYGSNRGHDSIAAFRILANGELESVGFASTSGQTPRNFAVVPNEKFLLVANQDSNDVVVMQLDADGMPHATGEVYTQSHPVCLKLHPASQDVNE